MQKPGGSVITLAQNTYAANHTTTMGFHSYSVTNYRGNATQSVTPGAIKNITYFTTGSPASANDGNGHSVSMTMDASKNSAVPSAVTTGSLTSSFSWNGMPGITGSSGPPPPPPDK